MMSRFWMEWWRTKKALRRRFDAKYRRLEEDLDRIYPGDPSDGNTVEQVMEEADAYERYGNTRFAAFLRQRVEEERQHVDG